jgi:hypothetical protein
MEMMLEEETEGERKGDGVGGGKEDSASLIIKLHKTCNNLLHLD